MKHAKVNLFLLLFQMAYTLTLLAWILVALTSFMLFDSPEALGDAATVAFFIYVWIYPLAMIGTVVFSWVLYHKRKFKAAVWVNLIPLLWIIPLVILIYAT
ncbi:hypothetical protein [Paenibacillus radicis (ex Gao et al. 2016)]|uniref:Uncharacterized protein n=1 Tax=Paenibacillus radicis (ex Gao et al. 2016) TaxID=1737354 RepID=A0A917GQY2_9BACL|nr:hypothetical protein [Paenibacillus radicis (ex Gao et al. 2016)]GGG54484.1 hypothetical protein GCM10010918_04110 [Paenibacillus radicis (ex Gao et al. 2016)]